MENDQVVRAIVEAWIDADDMAAAHIDAYRRFVLAKDRRSALREAFFAMTRLSDPDLKVQVDRVRRERMQEGQ